MYWEILKRQMPLVTKEEQEKFKNATVTVIGCGGIGGLTIEMLARMGVGNLILVDEDEFDISNLNHQTLSSVDNIGQKKSEVACKKIEKINPHVNVTSYCEHVDEKNIEIGNDVWIGYGVQIMPGVKIADGCVIGAGAVVLKNVEEEFSNDIVDYKIKNENIDFDFKSDSENNEMNKKSLDTLIISKQKVDKEGNIIVEKI